MTIRKKTEITIQTDELFVEHKYVLNRHGYDEFEPGCNLSYWEGDEKRQCISMSREEAIAVANSIYKLFGI